MRGNLGTRKQLPCSKIANGADRTNTGQVSDFAWQDKSGDVWDDLGRLLLREGAVRVAVGRFLERRAYLKAETEARRRRAGSWSR